MNVRRRPIRFWRRRALIVNADDFGLSESINLGVVDAHRHGIVTSASLLVGHAASRQAADLAAQSPALTVGLHVDLGYPPSSPPGMADLVETQLAEFRRLTGRDPTHLDSHFNLHFERPGVAVVLQDVARRLGVPLRFFDRRIRHSGDFWGQSSDGTPNPAAVRLEALLAILEKLPTGISELTCHPGRRDDADSYGELRQLELETLCDPQARQALEREAIRLRSFDGV